MGKSTETENYYDVIILGGGAAGITAAISTKRHHPQLSVLIVDQTFALGRKILVSGAGRCNITNGNLAKDDWRKRYYCDTPQLLDSVFAQFGYNEIIAYFEDLGIKLYEEQKNNNGKIFPITDSAKNVVALLIDELQRLGVVISIESSCTKVTKSNSLFQLQINKENRHRLFTSKYLICATGGKTYPALGSDGSGYDLIKDLGHAILSPVPAAGPLISKDRICHELQGVKTNVSASLIIDGKIQKSGIDDLLFTQYGVSGSLIFNFSRHVSTKFNRGESGTKIFVVVDFLPTITRLELSKYLQKQWDKRPGQTVVNSLLGILNAKIASVLCRQGGINPVKQVKDINQDVQKAIIEKIKAYKIEIVGTKGWNESEFTAGGVRAAEINPKTLASYLVQGLYLCGEVINVDGDVGGFNLSWAWASGYLAGKLIE